MGKVPHGATPLGPGALGPMVEAALIFPRGEAQGRSTETPRPRFQRRDTHMLNTLATLRGPEFQPA